MVGHLRDIAQANIMCESPLWSHHITHSLSSHTAPLVNCHQTQFKDTYNQSLPYTIGFDPSIFLLNWIWGEPYLHHVWSVCSKIWWAKIQTLAFPWTSLLFYLVGSTGLSPMVHLSNISSSSCLKNSLIRESRYIKAFSSWLRHWLKLIVWYLGRRLLILCRH